MGRFIGAAHSAAAPGVTIYRGVSITSLPYKCPTYKNLQPLLPPRVTPTYEKKVERPWAPLKNYSTKGEGFGLKSFGGEVVKGKKMLFHTFFEVLMVG